MQNIDRGGTVAAPRRSSQTGSAENPESVSGTMLMNGDATGTMVTNSSNPSGTILADQGRGGTLLVAPGGDLPGGGLGTIAERGEDFAAALRSNAPAETSGYLATPSQPYADSQDTLTCLDQGDVLEQRWFE